MISTVPSDWPESDSFYSSPSWLRFVDSDGVAQPFYATADGSGMVAHHAPQDGHPDYRFDRVVDGADGRPRLLIGGRRGFCSPVVTTQRPPSALHRLIGAALDAVPDVGGLWWWPYLPSADVPHVVSAARVLGGDEPGVHLVGADCVVERVPADQPFESVLTKKQRRTNWRREWQRFVDSGLRLRRVAIDEVAASGAPLLQQVEQKYGNTHTVRHLESFLSRQARFLSDQAVVHAVFDGSRMTGYSLAYRWRDQLAVRLIGLDYPALRDAAEYAVLLMHGPARFARENGIATMHLGMDGYEAKCRRGARVRALWAVAPGTATSEAAIDRCAGRILAQLPTSEAAAFRAEVDSVCSSLTISGDIS